MAIDLSDAIKLVEARLARRPKHGFVVLHDRTERHAFGWVFYYAPRAFLETGDKDLLVPGTGPIVVTLSGEIVELPSNLPPNAAVAQYLQSLRRPR